MQLQDLKPPRLTLKTLLGALVFSALLPPLAFMASQARWATHERRAQIERDGRDLAEKVGVVAERLLAERAATLKALALSPALRTGDLSALYAHAKAILDPAEGVVLVSDSSPKLLLSTAVPYGAPLPEPNEPDTRARAVASGRVEVSGVFSSPFTGLPVVSLAMLAPGTDYVLRVTIRAEWFSEQLAALMPPGWILSVADRNGVLVGRSQDPNKWVGGPVSAPAWAVVSHSDGKTGWARSSLLEGTAVYFSWRRLPSGWTALAAVSERDLDLVANKQTTTVSIAALAIGLIGLLFAALTAVVIGRPLAQLSAAATAFGRGEELPAIASHIREIDDVVAALGAGARVRAAAEAALKARETDSRDFTYAASHDLKAPTSTLQMVFSQLQSRLDSGDIKTARELVRVGLGSVVRMRELLARLLDYSRVVDKERVAEEIDLATLVEDVLTDLRQQIVESGARITVGDLPTIRGDRVHFRALLQNLLSNAMKYRKPDVAPLIAISASQQSSAGLFSLRVKDNGIGVPPRFHLRIFEMFQRLHGQDAVPGTGLGLFICMRIVRLYGGDIRLSSEADQGAEFVVELPQAAGVRWRSQSRT